MRRARFYGIIFVCLLLCYLEWVIIGPKPGTTGTRDSLVTCLHLFRDLVWGGRGIVQVLVSQLYLTLCNPMDYSPPGSSVHGVLQARILEWGCHALPQGVFPIQGSNLDLLPCRWILYPLSHLGSPQSIFTALKIHCTLPIHLSSSHPCPNPWQLLIFFTAAFRKMSNSWNYTLCNLLRLTSFTR